MAAAFNKKIARWNVACHRDLGYFFSSLIIFYCISGISLNHLNEWNPDFIISRDTIHLSHVYTKDQVNMGTVMGFSKMVHENTYKIFDFPASNQVKIYYDNASLHINFENRVGIYESVTKRHLFYETNVLHRNSLKGWKWVSDFFALMLIVISVTGLFILKGKYGLQRRGIWIMLGGFLLPAGAIILFYLLNN